MSYAIDGTHNASLRSWIQSANDASTDFPPQNLPFCVFSTAQKNPRIGVGIGDQLLDLSELGAANLLPLEVNAASRRPSLNDLMGLELETRRRLRGALSQLVTDERGSLARDERIRSVAIVPQASVRFHVPVEIGDYTDFYASVFHATNVGSMFRPDNPLLPNYKFVPIGYHGRASSILISGTNVWRPSGQLPPPTEGSPPSFGPCQNLDYELELGFWIGRGNRLGDAIAISSAEQHLFGASLVNDWSARDIQRWEYQPLGPFLAKNFATTVSPWVVTFEALAPFRNPAFARPAGDPPPLPYLDDAANRLTGGIEMTFEVYVASEKMRSQGMAPMRLSKSSFASMYWTAAQMVAHHTSNGCNLRPGDLLASGTISGPERSSRGCLLELSWNGEYGKPAPGNQRTPIELPTGERRVFLADGDEVVFRGWCERAGYRRIGLGECRGTILAGR